MCLLNNDFRSSDKVASEDCIREERVGKDAEGNGRGIIRNTIPEFVLNTEENHEQQQ